MSGERETERQREREKEFLGLRDLGEVREIAEQERKSKTTEHERERKRPVSGR